MRALTFCEDFTRGQPGLDPLGALPEEDVITNPLCLNAGNCQ